jgi:Spy/CpxP family protein refolding chaperone
MKIRVLVVAGLVATAGWAVAQQPPQGPAPGPRGDRRGARMADPTRLKEELGLDDQQLGQLKKLRTENRRAAIKRHADVQLARLALRELMDSPSVDEKALQARTKELGDLHAANLRARAEARLALRKILTPEQQKKLTQLRARRPGPRLDGAPGPAPDGGPRRPGPRPRRGGAADDGEALTRTDGR